MGDYGMIDEVLDRLEEIAYPYPDNSRLTVGGDSLYTDFFYREDLLRIVNWARIGYECHRILERGKALKKDE